MAPKTMLCVLTGLLVPRLTTSSVQLSRTLLGSLPGNPTLGLDGQMSVERPEQWLERL